MPRYRKKPVVIEAEVFRLALADGVDWKGKDQLTYYPESFQKLFWVEDRLLLGAPYINTLEGKHYITEGDYIITGVKGERYPCKPYIFELTYELVEMEGEE